MTESEGTALVVDDNDLNRDLLRHMLRSIGWRVVLADSGTRALDLLRVDSFDMIMLDLRMPNLDGERTCRLIRDELRLADPWVVAFTAHGMPDELAKMRLAGFDDLLIKPVSPDDLRAACARAMQAPRSRAPAK